MSISYNGKTKIAELKTKNSTDDTYSVSVFSGSSIDGYSGNISVRSGSSTNLKSGNVNLITGNSLDGISGDINLIAGDGYISGGNINIKPGNGSLDGYIFLKNSNSNNALIIGNDCDFGLASNNDVLAKINNNSIGYISTVLPNLSINTGGGLTGGGNLTSDRTISIQPGLLDGYLSGVTVRSNTGSNVGIRPRINFIEGSNISLGIIDDPINDEIDITISSSSSLTPSASNDGSLTRRYDFTWTGSSIQINVNIATEFGFSEGSFQVEVRHILQEDSGSAIYWFQGLTSLRFDDSNNIESRPNFFPSTVTWSSLGPTDGMLMDVIGATSVRFTVGVDAGFPTPASGQLAVKLIPINPDMIIPIGSGGGDIIGPTFSSNNSVALFDGYTGKIIKQSSLIFDGYDLSGINNLFLDGTINGVDITAISSTYSLRTTQINTGSGLSGGGDLSTNRTISLQSGLLDGYMTGVIVRENSGSNIGTQPRLNFIEGSGVNLTITNDFVNSEIDITISSSGGSGSGNVVGPESSNNNAIAIFDGYDGYAIKNSALSISDNNTLVLPLVISPETPSPNNVSLFGRDVGGRSLPAFIGPSGLDTALQPHFGRNAIAIARPVGNSTTLSTFGSTISATGTATAKNSATTNRYTYMRGLEYLVTTPATTAVAGFRGPGTQYARGSGSSGGFHFICRWGPSTGVATATTRGFCGMRSSTSAPTDVNPSTLTNIIGMGWDNGDTNVQMMHNDGSGTATKIDLGSSFPRPNVDRTFVYEIDLFCPPGGSTVTYSVIDLVSGNQSSGVISTDLPGATQLLNAPYAYNSVGGTSSVIGTCLFGSYVETDY